MPLPRAVEEAVVDGDPDAAVADVRGVGADEHRLVVPGKVAPAATNCIVWVFWFMSSEIIHGSFVDRIADPWYFRTPSTGMELKTPLKRGRRP